MADTPQPSDKHRPTDEKQGEDAHNALNLVGLTKENSAHSSEKNTSHETLAPGKTTEQSVGTGADKRTYDVHVPKDWDGKSPLPVIYYFNGLRPDGTREPENFTGLSEQADKKGFAVVYMHGSNEKTQTYNNGQQTFANNVDENKYLNAIHDSLKEQLPLDETRQGLAGFSLGGSEAYNLAATNNWVASAQSVEGYMTGYEKPLNHAVSEQNIHALHDSTIPENGTDQECGMADRGMQNQLEAAKTLGDIPFDPMQLFHSVACAYERNGDNILPQSAILKTYKAADGITGDGQTIKTPDYSIYDFQNAKSGAEVKQITLNEGTHGWAGSVNHSGDIHFMQIGVPNEKVNAGELVADFFLEHKLVQEKE